MYVIVNSYSAVEEVVRNHEIESINTYTVYRRNKGYSQTISDIELKSHRLSWEEKRGENIIPYNGVPFITLGYDVRECQFGPDRNKGNKVKYANKKIAQSTDDDSFLAKGRRLPQPSKKADCPARISIKRILRFPKFKVDGIASSWKKKVVSKNFHKSCSLTESVEEFHVFLPSNESHVGHITGQFASLAQPVDRRIRAKIANLTEEGVSKVSEMKRHIKIYVKNELQLTDKAVISRRLNPTDKDVRNFMASHNRKSKSTDKTMEESLFDRILSNSCSPLLFNHAIDKWSVRQWTLQTLASKFPDIVFTSKISSRSTEGFQWESDCEHLEVTFKDFYEWIEGVYRDDNPLQSYNKELYSCYIDYKYMKDAFGKYPHVMKEVDWGVMGLPSYDGNTSTIWIGSEGCYTNCHYDTYGFNLVAQIYGRKRWILFPPSDTSKLYQTRLPYEESSVFSSVHIVNPDMNEHLLFKESHPYVVDLEPGQVLYVPRHWWHHVECLEPAISINTWVEMEEDNESRCDEAITKFLFMNMYDVHRNVIGSQGDDVFTTKTKPWLNPYEEVTNSCMNLAIMNCAWSKLIQSSVNRSDKANDIRMFAQYAEHCALRQKDGKGVKRRREDGDGNKASLVTESPTQEAWESDASVTELTSINFDLFLKMFTKKQTLPCEKDGCSRSNSNVEDENGTNSCPNERSNVVTIETLTSCLLHPDVISVVTSLMKKQLKLTN